MRKSQRNLRPGDVIQIKIPQGSAYAQCMHKHAVFGHLIRVLPGHFEKPLREFSTLVAQPELYSVFLLWGSNVDRQLIRVVAHEDVPEKHKAYALFKDGVPDPATGKVSTWWLWDGEKEWKVGSLTEEQKHYSPRAVWNDLLLVQRISEKWKPSDEV